MAHREQQAQRDEQPQQKPHNEPFLRRLLLLLPLLLLIATRICRAKRTFSGATRISCFFERMRRKVRSFCGSRLRTAERALAASPRSCEDICSATAVSSVLRMGAPSWLAMTMPTTPLCELMRLSVSSTSDMAWYKLRAKRAGIKTVSDALRARRGG